MISPQTTISVIICAYTEARWAELLAAVKSVQAQTVPPQEIIVVVDHNPKLLAQVRAQVSGIISIENQGRRGLSGARNSGLAIAQGEIIAFLDEDAIAAPDWLAQLQAAYADPVVMGVGGTIEPVWVGGRPRWFPEEFDWVVGCTYRGLPQKTAPVRNLIGCNMSFRREVFGAGNRFRVDMGRIGTHPVGCEETEFSIRVGHQWPQQLLLYQPEARVYHRVPPARASQRYFLARCYAEGLSKAQVARFAGVGAALVSERHYVVGTLSRGIWRGLTDTFRRRELIGLSRAGVITLGLTFTTAGFLAGTVLGIVSQIKERLGEVYSRFRRARSIRPFQPVQMLEVELSRPLPAVVAYNPSTGRRYQQALALVRLHTTPLGLVELTFTENGLTPANYADRIWTALASTIKAHLAEAGLPDIAELGATGLPAAGEAGRIQPELDAPYVTVVVATHDRPDNLAVCLAALLRLDYPNFDVIVVDNAPSTKATAEFIEQNYGHSDRVRYLREERPGLAAAHNRGLKEVRTEIVAFTDDDVLVDSHWLTELVRGFDAAERVACVTGLILPVEIETPAQAWFEEYGGFNKGFARRIYDLGDNRPVDPLYPFTAGRFGSGASMAFRTAVLRAGGGFDPVLGTGTTALGGDDLAAFFQIVASGYQLVYQPAAILHHRHRRDYAALRRQTYGYGVGLTAFLMKTLVDRPGRIFDLAARIPAGLTYIFSRHSPKNRSKGAHYPGELTRIERLGMLYGPIAYWRSCWRSPVQPAQIEWVESPAPPRTVAASAALAREVSQR